MDKKIFLYIENIEYNIINIFKHFIIYIYFNFYISNFINFITYYYFLKCRIPFLKNMEDTLNIMNL